MSTLISNTLDRLCLVFWGKTLNRRSYPNFDPKKGEM